jgi:hypothetical protein
MTVSTHKDWNPRNVDLMTLEDYSEHGALPLNELKISERYDPSFPPFLRDPTGTRRWRLPDLNEWADGQR